MKLPDSEDWVLSPENAHPNAKALFSESFFWDGIDDSAPWGSDEGADALAAFRHAHEIDGSMPDPAGFARRYLGNKWRKHALTNERNTVVLDSYSCANMAMIAIALGMILLHGYVPAELKIHGLEAIDRELRPNCFNRFGFPDERVRKLQICRERLMQAATKRQDH